MLTRTTFLLAMAIIPAMATAREALAQRCIGTTSYLVRDTLGRVLSVEQLKGLSNIRLDGVPLRLVSDAGERSHYEYDFVRRQVPWDSMVTKRVVERAVAATNPLVFDGRMTSCGELGDLTLAYGGKVMRMLFDIREHNTYYEIDSPPFQEGTFHLRSLACEGGAAPPRIDNRTTGKCLVPADSWDGMDRDWVRAVVAEYHGGGWVHVPADACRSRGLVAITRQNDVAALWRSHPEALDRAREPTLDFRWQLLLAVYRAGHDASFAIEAIRVDKSGDLTFAAQTDDRSDPASCSIVVLGLYRSGVHSIAGKPLPSPSP
jgi:hypothetical protein